MNDDELKLSKGDQETVEAIALALKRQLVQDFYKELGKGAFALLWRAAFAVLLVVAAYGAMHNKSFLDYVAGK
jgi:hypothetical protein